MKITPSHPAYAAIKRKLPKGFEPTCVVPRAVCALKMGSGCATFQWDVEELSYREEDPYNRQGCDIRRYANDERTAVTHIRQGDWVTLVYAVSIGCQQWFWIPKVKLDLKRR